MTGRPVSLVYLARPLTGGWVSFTAHLYHGLIAAGYQPVLRKAGRRTETSERPFGFGLRYVNTSLPMLERLAADQPVIVAAAEPAQAAALAALRAAGAGVVVHDPTELKRGTPAALAAGNGPVWCIRRAMLAHLPDAALIRHPYQRMTWMPGGLPGQRRMHAVAYSRLDWDKHTDTIAEANALLRPGQQVHLYGTENRMYTHHKLEAAWPGWRAAYHGAMPRTDLHAGARLAADAAWAVDLSAIKGDGGGTQYTFLEALDAGARLVISAKWLTGDPHRDTMAPYAHPVGGAAELAALLAGPLPPRPDPAPLLAAHDPQQVATTLMEAW